MQTNHQELLSLYANYTQILNKSDILYGNLTLIQESFSKAQSDSKKFININKVTLEGLMDSLMTQDNTNVTFEISYSSTRDSKSRFIRSSVDFKSVYGTA